MVFVRKLLLHCATRGSPERQGTLAFDSSMIDGMVKFDLNHNLIGLDFFQSQDVIVSKFKKMAKKMLDDVELQMHIDLPISH